MAVLCACTAVGLFVLGRALDSAATNREERCAREADSKLAVLRSLLPAELPAPPEAVRESREEYGGDCTSDAPAIEWRYRYSGTPAGFVDFYSAELTRRGWQPEPPGNVPGQLKTFSRTESDHRYLLVLYGPVPGVVDDFSVSLRY